MGFQPGQQTNAVPRRCQRQFGNDDGSIYIAEQMRIVDQHVAWQIDDRTIERGAKFFLQLEEGGAVGHDRRIDGCLGRKQRQFFVGLDHGAFNEQAVNPAGVVDRIGQAATGLQVQRKSSGAEMNVEVKQRGQALPVMAEQPGQRGRNGRCADAAARADHSGRDMGLFGLMIIVFRCIQDRLRLRQDVAQLVRTKRFQQIVLQAADDKIAIQAYVVHLTHGNHNGARFADLGQ